MKHVLIVDDSMLIRNRLKALLDESPDIRIVGQAGSGRQAMEAVRKFHPDTVLLDIRLPDRNGIELLKEIKSRRPDITVIMLTNYDYDKYRQQSMQSGADHFLNKTLEFEKIINTITGQNGS